MASKVKDLGIIFASDFTFIEHIINETHDEGIQVFVFLKHDCWEFHNPICLYGLYFSFLRSILEYGSTIWRPNQDYLIKKLEQTQNRFSRMLGYETILN